jgi:hypothetical protein
VRPSAGPSRRDLRVSRRAEQGGQTFVQVLALRQLVGEHALELAEPAFALRGVDELGDLVVERSFLDEMRELVRGARFREGALELVARERRQQDLAQLASAVAIEQQAHALGTRHGSRLPEFRHLGVGRQMLADECQGTPWL